MQEDKYGERPKDHARLIIPMSATIQRFHIIGVRLERKANSPICWKS
jgi:hypothetical protein